VTSKANSNAIVITDLTQPEFPALSLSARFPVGPPTSRADARSRVALGLEASYKIFHCYNQNILMER
jgi:hypothetical protein